MSGEAPTQKFELELHAVGSRPGIATETWNRPGVGWLGSSLILPLQLCFVVSPRFTSAVEVDFGVNLILLYASVSL